MFLPDSNRVKQKSRPPDKPRFFSRLTSPEAVIRNKIRLGLFNFSVTPTRFGRNANQHPQISVQIHIGYM
jgi:hypothetical protein